MLKSFKTPNLSNCDRQTLLNYFEHAWELETILFKSLATAESFDLNPDPLRNRLIFYLGHSPAFYINKLIAVGLLEQHINPEYEILFEIGVDPETPEELQTQIQDIAFPDVAAVWQYRSQAQEVIADIIKQIPLNLPIHQNHPLWALMMGIEHSRIHFETSSMLIRQLPTEKLTRPESWQYAASAGKVEDNEMLRVAGGVAELGKSYNDNTYGWDSDYGKIRVEVKPFLASKYLITNGDFLEFLADDGYNNPDFWHQAAWAWKQEYNVQHPKFWLVDHGNYQYRAMFDVMDLPLDYPAEVNYYEAIAYCAWKGEGIRLMSEAEWTIAAAQSEEEQNFNLDIKFGSPNPVGMLQNAANTSGLYDLRGNVWQWLNDDFDSLPGFQPHSLYADYSAPFCDTKHKVMRGGSWASTGAFAAFDCRNWFRPNFYQHAGFRIAKNL